MAPGQAIWAALIAMSVAHMVVAQEAKIRVEDCTVDLDAPYAPDTAHACREKIIAAGCHDAGSKGLEGLKVRRNCVSPSDGRYCLFKEQFADPQCNGPSTGIPSLIAPCGYCERDYENAAVQGIKYACSKDSWEMQVCTDTECGECHPSTPVQYECEHGVRTVRAPCPWLYTQQLFQDKCDSSTAKSAEAWYLSPAMLNNVTFTCVP